ncbi:Transducin (beta)-like 3 [Gaertneriomyces sp. JEL0708]|nr:Transducin (beta)-like 3 [Gaertneriomyces sp. JEL0708]
MSKLQFKSIFKATGTIESIYTGGQVCVSPDESQLLTVCGEDIYITQLSTGQLSLKLEGENDVITSFAISEDGKRVISASRGGLAIVWDASTGEIQRRWKLGEGVVVSMDTKDGMVACGAADGVVTVWDVNGGFCTHRFPGHGGVVSCVKVFHDEDENGNERFWVLSGSEDTTIRVWDLLESRPKAVLEGHVSVVREMVITEDGKWLVSCGRDKVAMLWSLSTMEAHLTLPVYEGLETVGLLPPNVARENFSDELHENSICIYTAGGKGIIRIWDLLNSKCLYAQAAEPSTKHMITSTIFLAASIQLVAVTSDQNIIFHTLSDKHLIRTRQIAGYNQEVLDVTFVGPNEKHLAVVSNTEQLRVYDLDTMNCEICYGHSEIIMSVAGSTNGDLVATGGRDRLANVWKFNPTPPEDSETYSAVQLLGTAAGHTEPVSTVAWPMKTSSWFVTGSLDRTVKVWDIPESISSAHTEPIKLKARLTFLAHDKDVQSLTISPNDKLIASGSLDKTAKLFTVDGQHLGTFKGHKRGIWCVRFSPVDQILATASTDKTIKLWSLSTFAPLKTLEGHLNSILQLRFCSFGTQLLSTSSDGLMKLWTVRTGECAFTGDEHEDRVWGLAVSKNEEICATGSGDGKVVLWKDATREVEAEKQKEVEQEIELQQALSNHLATSSYLPALRITLRLNHPKKTLDIISQILNPMSLASLETYLSEDLTPSETLVPLLHQLNTQELSQLLNHISLLLPTRSTSLALRVLHLLFTHIPLKVEEVLEKDKKMTQALIAYVERYEGVVKRVGGVGNVLGWILGEDGETGQDLEDEDEEVEADVDDEMSPNGDMQESMDLESMSFAERMRAVMKMNEEKATRATVNGTVDPNEENEEDEEEDNVDGMDIDA